ncbi:hypothetical protein ACHAWF_008573 [Thalassiosira exigua]
MQATADREISQNDNARQVRDTRPEANDSSRLPPARLWALDMRGQIAQKTRRPDRPLVGAPSCYKLQPGRLVSRLASSGSRPTKGLGRNSERKDAPPDAAFEPIRAICNATGAISRASFHRPHGRTRPISSP